MVRRVTRILCVADPRGSADAVEHLLTGAPDLGIGAVVLIGDVGVSPDRADSYRRVLYALATGDCPAFWVPGPGDAPIEETLREAHGAEVVLPSLRCIHGTVAYAPGPVVFAGLGGEISDAPGAAREELTRLRYPRWEPEHRLRLLRDLKPHELVLAFATPPAHKGLGDGGSDVVAEMVGSYVPRIAVCGGPRGSATLGRSLVVAPGSLADGHYAVADLQARRAELSQLALPA
jgi:Icc-related predicted phosphoesterase